MLMSSLARKNLEHALSQSNLFDMDALPVPASPRRLFTALFPDASACAAIDAERQRWPGQPRRRHPIPERLHITFQFFNRVDAPHERDWLAALQDLRFEPFEVVLVQAELWHAPSGIIAVMIPEMTPELAALHRVTAKLAQQAGLPAAVQGWKPHLTTLRKAEKLSLEPLTQAIRWQASDIKLIWSDLKSQPPRYHTLGCVDI